MSKLMSIEVSSLFYNLWGNNSVTRIFISNFQFNYPEISTGRDIPGIIKHFLWSICEKAFLGMRINSVCKNCFI